MMVFLLTVTIALLFVFFVASAIRVSILLMEGRWRDAASAMTPSMLLGGNLVTLSASFRSYRRRPYNTDIETREAVRRDVRH